MKLNVIAFEIITTLALHIAELCLRLLEALANKERSRAEQQISASHNGYKALKTLIDEAERVAWQDAYNEPATYPHLARTIEAARIELQNNIKVCSHE